MTPPTVSAASLRLNGQRRVVDDRARAQLTRRAAIAHLQRARTDRGCPAVAVGPGQRRRAGARLGQRARPADRPAERHGIGAVEGEGAVVDHVADNAAGGPAVAHLQRARADRRAAAVGVRAGEAQRPCPGFDQAGCAVDDRADSGCDSRVRGDRRRHAAQRQSAARQ